MITSKVIQRHEPGDMVGDYSMLENLRLPFVPRVGETLEIRTDDAPYGFEVTDVTYILDIFNDKIPLGDWYCVVEVRVL